MNTILLTGATGNLGSRIMAEFIKHENIKLITLVYAPDQEDAKKQIDKAFAFWECNPDARHRIEVVKGDITNKHMLGFSEEEYHRIGQEITHIIHCAANFKINLSLEEATKSIVGGTENLVALAQEAHRKGTFRRFNYISSLDALGDLHGVVKEEFLSTTKRNFINTYQITKAMAEDFLIKESKDTNFPITVYRPSMLVGDSKSGKIINPQSMYRMIKDMLLEPASKVLPGKDFSVDPMPLDFISEGMFFMYDAEETKNKAFHLVSGPEASLLLPEFIKEVRDIYKEKTGVDYAVGKFISPEVPYMLLRVANFLTFGLIQDLKLQKDMVQYFLLDSRPENKNMKEFLASKGMTIPKLTDYLPILCDYMIKENKAVIDLQVRK